MANMSGATNVPKYLKSKKTAREKVPTLVMKLRRGAQLGKWARKDYVRVGHKAYKLVDPALRSRSVVTQQFVTLLQQSKVRVDGDILLDIASGLYQDQSGDRLLTASSDTAILALKFQLISPSDQRSIINGTADMAVIARLWGAGGSMASCNNAMRINRGYNPAVRDRHPDAWYARHGLAPKTQRQREECNIIIDNRRRIRQTFAAVAACRLMNETNDWMPPRLRRNAPRMDVTITWPSNAPRPVTGTDIVAFASRTLPPKSRAPFAQTGDKRFGHVVVTANPPIRPLTAAPLV